MDNIIPRKVKLEQTSGLLCEKCGNDTFREAVMIRKISRFLATTPSGEDEHSFVPTFTCTKCDQVVNEFLPEMLRKPVQNEQS